MNPGRQEEFVAMIKKAKAVIEPLGVNLRSVSLGLSVIEGAHTGTYSLRLAYGDLQSWAATLAREEEDEAFKDQLRKGMGADSPAVMKERLLAQDIVEPVYSSNFSNPGTVLQLASATVKPGRLDDFRAMNQQESQLLLDSGASCVRTVMILVGGEGSGRVASVREYADMGAFAESWMKRHNDAVWNQHLAALSGPDSPVVLESQSHALWIEVPL